MDDPEYDRRVCEPYLSMIWTLAVSRLPRRRKPTPDDMATALAEAAEIVFFTLDAMAKEPRRLAGIFDHFELSWSGENREFELLFSPPSGEDVTPPEVVPFPGFLGSPTRPKS